MLNKLIFTKLKSIVKLPLKYQRYNLFTQGVQERCQQSQLIQEIRSKTDLIQGEDGTKMPDTLKHPDFFEVANLFTVKDLFNARVHYGHTMGTLNEHMNQFILGHRLGTLIFDLDQTAELLREALNFAAHIAFRDGLILFIARYKQNSYLIEKTAMECGEYSHTRHWSTGTFTDPNRLGLMTRLPDLVIFLNTLNSVFETHTAVLETNKMLIPSIGIVDTNCFPNYITYPIPGNDDTPQAIELYCKLFKEAILKGKSKRKEVLEALEKGE